MRQRQKMSKKRSRKVFRKGAKVHHKNNMRPMRGGIRL